MTKLEKLIIQYDELDAKFLEAKTTEECRFLVDEYDRIKEEINSIKQEQEARALRFKEIHERPSKKTLGFVARRLINKPLSDFLISSTAENFTTPKGVERRKKHGKILRPILKNFVLEKFRRVNVIVDSYPDLPKDENFIFVSTHNGDFEIQATVGALDRNAYILLGTTEQILYNPIMYFAYLNGIYYVNKFDEASRKGTLDKEEKLLLMGTSILKWPEGSINDTENIVVQELFPGVMTLINRMLEKHNKVFRVVPVSTFRDFGSKDMHIAFGDPLDLTTYENDEEALKSLRTVLSFMTLDQFKAFAKPLVYKENLNFYNSYLDYLEVRRINYLKVVKWSKNVFDEEISPYKPKPKVTEIPGGYKTDVDSRDVDAIFLRDIEKVLKDKNSSEAYRMTIRAILKELAEHERRDMTNYMTENWDKPVDRKLKKELFNYKK